uniref:Uncharacterized protein n=1 Tax=Rhizophora mucronata TaxID=61149 RepID=A0A2P2NTC9_RHIMU
MQTIKYEWGNVNINNP